MLDFLYNDTTDAVLAIVVAAGLITCFSTTVLTALFPCSCNPRRDCRRNCADCERDRKKCRRRAAAALQGRQSRSDTEEELIQS